MENNQHKNTKTVIWTIILIIVLASIAWYAYRSSRGNSANNFSTTASSTPITTGTEATTTGGLGISYSGSSTPIITVISNVSGGIPANIPSLSRPITFPASLSTTSEATLQSQITTLEAALTKDPSQFIDWMQLGTDRKVIQDYQGAAQAWIYASELNPTDYVSLGNLGDLYGYYIHDNAEAEMYYAEAIKNAPTAEYLYFNTADFYQQVEKSQSKALAIAEQGVKANPGNQDLENLLKSLQGATSSSQ